MILKPLTNALTSNITQMTDETLVAVGKYVNLNT